jgi:predicted phage tail component-like protein
LGFLFGGVSSQSMKIRARLTSWVVSPARRNAYETVPGKPGVADFGSDSAERLITVKCGIMPQRSFAALVTVLDGVAGWLDPEGGVKQLVLDDVPDRYYKARLTEAVNCERLLRTAGAFDLQFICPDPYAYAFVDETASFGQTGTHTFTRHIGNATSEPVYLIKGEIASGSGRHIKITTGGEALYIVGPLAVGETLLIDSGLVTAKVIDSTGATVRNGLPNMRELNFPTLRTGTNELVIETENASFVGLEIKANSRWR